VEIYPSKEAAVRKTAFLASLALAAVVAGVAHAQTVNVQVADPMRRDDMVFGRHELDRQADRLGEIVERALKRQGGFEGAVVNLVLVDVRPNRPTYEQIARRPGLDPHRSVSIGGAEIRGEIVMADGSVRAIRPFDWYSHSVAEVQGYTTWYDAERAYARFASGVASGRLL
jgi:hypothetical protein